MALARLDPERPVWLVLAEFSLVVLSHYVERSRKFMMQERSYESHVPGIRYESNEIEREHMIESHCLPTISKGADHHGGAHQMEDQREGQRNALHPSTGRGG